MPGMKRKTVLNVRREVRLDATLDRQLRARARAEDRNESTIIRRALRHYFEQVAA